MGTSSAPAEITITQLLHLMANIANGSNNAKELAQNVQAFAKQLSEEADAMASDLTTKKHNISRKVTRRIDELAADLEKLARELHASKELYETASASATRTAAGVANAYGAEQQEAQRVGLEEVSGAAHHE